MEELKVKFLMGPPDCNDPHIPEYSENYLKELGKVLGMPVVCSGNRRGKESGSFSLLYSFWWCGTGI